MPPTLLEELLRQHPEMDEREARGRIMRGDVLIGTTEVAKPGMSVREGSELSLRPARRFVSRAGLKLEGAIEGLGIEPKGKTVVDGGSSTGGFTDCLLRHGAAHVYSVDVGTNQLAWPLRKDRRVTVLEGTNVMSLGSSSFSVPPDWAVCDLSFRSIRAAAAHLVGLVSERRLLALVKPQFEWMDPPPGFHGVVPAGELLGILSALVSDLSAEGLAVEAVRASSLSGRRGNREFFFLISPGAKGRAACGEAELEAALREGVA
jgi:23S rRNA (cytidine1920-2'-O)/16S rRNA (cytidine1409-2'-O)-methyltransferase